MSTRQYRTIADELLSYIDPVSNYFRTLGYTVRIEKLEVGFPYTPTFLCRRGKITTIIAELDTKVDMKRLQDWIHYGKSCGRDVRLALCVPSSVAIADSAALQAAGVGLYRAFVDHVEEQIAPVDLALNIALPRLDGAPQRVRELLGPSYEQFRRAQWREGFEDACQAVEAEARRYLKRWSRTGRILIVRKSGAVRLSNGEIDRLTMGQLAGAFANIQAQNHADSVVAQLLSKLNQDRIAVVHHKRRATTEKRLRTNVGQHMWAIVAALKMMV